MLNPIRHLVSEITQIGDILTSQWKIASNFERRSFKTPEAKEQEEQVSISGPQLIYTV